MSLFLIQICFKGWNCESIDYHRRYQQQFNSGNFTNLFEPFYNHSFNINKPSEIRLSSSPVEARMSESPKRNKCFCATFNMKRKSSGKLNKILPSSFETLDCFGGVYNFLKNGDLMKLTTFCRESPPTFPLIAFVIVKQRRL